MSLLIAGEGDERDRVGDEISRLWLARRVRLLGALPRNQVLDLFAAADATVLSSSWENFPHSVVESLAVGTPVISTAAGGVAEVVTDGSNGLLVPVGDAAALAAAIERYFSDDDLREKLRGQASRLGRRVQHGERARGDRRSARGGAAVTPRVLFVARTRYALPLTPTLQRRFDALADVIDWRQFGTSATGEDVADERFTLVGRFPVARLDGAAFYGALPVRLAREIRAFHPDVLIVQGAEDTALALVARRLARSSVPVVFDVHGDWRNNTRVYGSPGRRLISPVADGLARLTLRHADAVRTVSGFTSGLVREQGVEPIATFPAYMDLGPFLESPPAAFPDATDRALRRRARAVQGDRRARRGVASGRRGTPRCAAAHRRRGTPREHRSPARRMSRPSASAGRSDSIRPGVSRALDEATLLVLPSRREGMGRVIVEAFCRGRPVVGTRSGGIPDLVEDDVNGLLVPADDAEALAAALERVLGDVALAERLGAGASAFGRRVVGDAGGVRAARSRARRRRARPCRFLDCNGACLRHQAASQERGLPRGRHRRAPETQGRRRAFGCFSTTRSTTSSGNPGSVPTALFAEHMG